MTEVIERLRVLLDSSTPIVIMETADEVRAVRLVRQACSELNLAVFEWSIASGLSRCGVEASTSTPERSFEIATATSHYAPTGIDATDVSAKAMYNSRDPVQALSNLEAVSVEAAFILKDFHRHMEDPVVVRRLRDVGQRFSQNRRTVIITAPSVTVPNELASLVEFLALPLPDKQRLRQIIDEVMVRVGNTRTLKRTLDAQGIDCMTSNLCGLTEEEAERAVSQAIVRRYGLTPEVVADVVNSKQEMLRRSEMLDFVEASDGLASLGGLENLKSWLGERRGTWDAAARAFGLEPPKGVIILGVQGCGKSMCARAIAGEWKLPLVKFDIAAVFNKYIGETEKRIQKVFQVAEQLAPCVLWIDELEKIFAGSGADSASVDAGVSSRLLAAFLSWMQDRKAPVFVAATCNNVTALPPELIRKGRFDDLFFVDLPNQTERRQILSIQLSKRVPSSKGIDADQVAEAARGYSGAEIEAAVQSAMYTAFARAKAGGHDDPVLSTENLLNSLRKTIPLSTTRAEEIANLRQWAAGRAVPASLPEAKARPA